MMRRAAWWLRRGRSIGPGLDRRSITLTGWRWWRQGAPLLGWSRLELSLSAPYAVETAAMRTDPETGAAEIAITLAPSSRCGFCAPGHSRPGGSAAPTPRRSDDTFTVVLDPGHGGVDPGAEADGLSEAELMLTFARALSEALIRTGLVEVVMTREADVFVSLPERISIARAAEADLFLSLHADALAEGRARGATVYTLAEEASDAASASLAEQHDRTDLLLGVDLTLADDGVAQVLMDLARHDTAPRSAAFADTIVAAFQAADIPLHPQASGSRPGFRCCARRTSRACFWRSVICRTPRIARASAAPRAGWPWRRRWWRPSSIGATADAVAAGLRLR